MSTPIDDIPFLLRLPSSAVGFYKDEAMTIPAADGDLVRAYRDEIYGTGVIAIAPSDADRMTLRISGGAAFLTGGRLVTNVPVSALPASYSAAYASLATGTGSVFAANTGGPQRFFHLTYPDRSTRTRYNGLSFTSTAGWSKIIYVYDEAISTETFWENGLQKATSSAGVPGDSGFLTIGATESGQWPFNGAISALYISDFAWTGDQRARIETEMSIPAKASVRVDLPGNSITAGWSASDQTFPSGTSWASRVAQALPGLVSNFGSPGASSAAVMGQLGQVVLNAATTHVVVIGEQVNDIDNYGVDAATAAQNMRNLCQFAKDFGLLVILWTCVTDASSANLGAKLASNAALVADFPAVEDGIIHSGASYADLLVDLGSLDWSGLLPDHLHPNDDGHEQMAAPILQAVQMLLPSTNNPLLGGLSGLSGISGNSAA